jgi:hypothetical protein
MKDIYEILDDYVENCFPLYTMKKAIDEGTITKEDLLGYITLSLQTLLKETK